MQDISVNFYIYKVQLCQNMAEDLLCTEASKIEIIWRVVADGYQFSDPFILLTPQLTLAFSQGLEVGILVSGLECRQNIPVQCLPFDMESLTVSWTMFSGAQV